MWCPETEAVLREAKAVRDQLQTTLRTLEQFEQRLRAASRETTEHDRGYPRDRPAG
jgi:hypothetical protein